MTTEVSSTRLYLGNLPRNATKSDVEAHFATHGTGEITEVKLMNGFGFIEYKDPMDAQDVVPAFHGSNFMGERLTVQFAHGPRHREGGFGNHERAAPRPRRTPHRMQITGLPNDTSWQDLKDFARQSSLDVVYSETGRDSNGRGFVEFETAADLRTAVEKLDGREFKGQRVQCVADVELSLTFPPATVVDPALRDDARTHLPWMTTTAVVLLAAIVLAAMDTATETEAHDETTMMTEPAIDHHLADQWRTILLPLLAVATMTRTDATTLLPRTLMPMVDRRTTGLLETSLRERVDTPGRDIPVITIVVDATDSTLTKSAKSAPRSPDCE
ncbi:hypothetical protein NCS55_00299900 [Fusarium keratoplasticum]|nr:hypothetical protein NCS55_00299900 [Fusarium keratoplasticum]